MARLTKEALQELDEVIDRSVGSEALLSLPRDVALMSLLRFLRTTAGSLRWAAQILPMVHHS